MKGDNKPTSFWSIPYENRIDTPWPVTGARCNAAVRDGDDPPGCYRRCYTRAKRDGWCGLHLPANYRDDPAAPVPEART